ncbi:CRAL/TRIO domain-containing protein [Plasmodium brasilianum]|uniref:CRAL-TRIO domain-containing protein n=2 Tax=Plasmodium (Plasmodium) TaxID=418103 RepID=A0A1A8VTS9_PLAMA|nr:CRAL/TRIO domain-containing protein [Plasmodium brasilianum]SBS83881.1 conserved Plasmodium protein, unknown function [Plasmodium malariae]
MDDNDSFASFENSNNSEASYGENKHNMNLDNFLDYDFQHMKDEEKYKYIGTDIVQRQDYFEIKNGKIEFLEENNVNYENFALYNRKKEQVDIFHKLKKELYGIAFKNHNNKLKNIPRAATDNDLINDTNKKRIDNTSPKSIKVERNKEEGDNEDRDKEEGGKENGHTKNGSTKNGSTKNGSAKNGNTKSKEKNKKIYELLNNDIGLALGNKLEDTYNDIKSSVNWLGNFFSNSQQNDEKKYLKIFYKDLYFVSDITIIRFLDTYNYNMIKSLNKIIKFILWRQMSIKLFNNNKNTSDKMDCSNTSSNINSDNAMGSRGTNMSGANASGINTSDINNSSKDFITVNSLDSNSNCDNSIVFINPSKIKNILMKTNIFRCGYDKKLRPMMYVRIQEKLNMQEDELFLLLVYHVDMCVNSINYNKCFQEINTLDNNDFEKKKEIDETTLQLVIVVDCLKFELNNMLSVDCIKKIINIFNEFYTDVLFRIYVINIPSFFKKVWSVYNMFIDNHTLKKIIFINKKNINLMYDHIDTNVMKHFDKNLDKKSSENSSIFFPSNSLYYKYDEMYYKKLISYVNTWVDKMVKANH